jgi:CheY-like chemotaxis protein
MSRAERAPEIGQGAEVPEKMTELHAGRHACARTWFDRRIVRYPSMAWRLYPCFGKDLFAMKYGRVLLADGHLGMLGGVHGLLDGLFETVLMVADERSLIDAVKTFKPDLVVVDLSLPRTGEANVARSLLERDSRLRVIVLSVHDDPTVVGQLLNAGVAGFILKRAAATHLVAAIEEVLRGGTYVCPSLRAQVPRAGVQLSQEVDS